MDDLLYIISKLDIPERGYSDLVELRKKAIRVHDADITVLNTLIGELSSLIDSKSSTPQEYDDLPILYFLRAHCYFVYEERTGNRASDAAMKDIEKAGEKFSIYIGDWNEWNVSLTHCYHGLLHSRLGMFESCQKKLTDAMEILTKLEGDFTGTRHYEKLEKVKTQIIIVAKHLNLIGKWNAYSDHGEKNIFHEIGKHRIILQEQRERLIRYYEDLRRNNQKIPPSLVATLFYLYKILYPSHSVYCEVPKPASNREKMLYDELLSKVRLFEVVEKLVAMEREFHPTASRAELLGIISKAWDEDMNNKK